MTDWQEKARASYRAVKAEGGTRKEARIAYIRTMHYEKTTIPDSQLSPRVKALIAKYRDAPP